MKWYPILQIGYPSGGCSSPTPVPFCAVGSVHAYMPGSCHAHAVVGLLPTTRACLLHAWHCLVFYFTTPSTTCTSSDSTMRAIRSSSSSAGCAVYIHCQFLTPALLHCYGSSYLLHYSSLLFFLLPTGLLLLLPTTYHLTMHTLCLP